MPGRLSVSRTFGDIEAKVSKYGGNPNVIIAEPEIKSFQVKDDYDFVLLGCDGVFDKLTNKEIIDQIWKTARSSTGSIHAISGQCAEMTLKLSLAKRTLDNVTAVMVTFGSFKN